MLLPPVSETSPEPVPASLEPIVCEYSALIRIMEHDLRRIGFAMGFARGRRLTLCSYLPFPNRSTSAPGCARSRTCSGTCTAVPAR